MRKSLRMRAKKGTYVALVSLMTCSVLAIQAHAQTATNQAPMLEPLVESGELPPVAERVGSEPLVLTPVDGVRNYGGNLRQVYSGAGDESWLWTFYTYEPMMRWNVEGNGVVPNIAEGYEVNEDATEYIFDLREGMKWSDGEPFTAHDIVFWAEHVQFNENIDPEIRLSVITPEDGMKVEAVDDYTLKMSFERPKSLLPLSLAQTSGIWIGSYPRHYLEQFHEDFNENAEAEAIEAGFTSWEERFVAMHNPFTNLEKPTINPWLFTTSADDTQIITLERNPYYWKIDDQGNQLPYIDESTLEVVEDFEVMLLKVLNGEVDYNARYVNTPANRAVMYDNAEKAGLEFFEIVDPAASQVQIHINQTAQDPVLRDLFSNRDARIALSHAIDRQEIIDIVFAGQGTPHQISPRPEETAFYDEEMGTQFTEYDPELANQILDTAGYDKRDANGWRLSPDGEPIAFIITTRADRQPYVDLLPFLAEDWQDVGFNVQWRTLEKSAKNVLRDSNQHHVLVDDGDGASMSTYVYPRAYVPLDADAAWMTGWVHWATGDGNDPQEPPEWMKEVISLHQQMQLEPDLERQADLYRQILEIHKQQFNILGLGLPVNRIGITTDRLRNVPDLAYASSAPLFPGPTQIEQFAILEE